MTNVLVVDDSMLIRHTVCRWLEERGYVVETASNGQEALQRIAERKPDLIITDLQMPRMSGSELLAVVRSQPATQAVPVIVLASKQSGPVAERAPAAEHLRIYKDIDIEAQLERAVGEVLASVMTV